MNHFLKTSLAAASLALVGFSASAADHTLVISSWAPPSHGLNALQWPRFVELIEEATDGKVTAELKLGLAPPPAQMDLVQDGVADLSVIFHGYQPGRFVTTKLVELPGYEGSAEASAVAYWEVFDQHLSKANEHRGVKVLGLFTHGPAQLHSSSPVTTLDQVAGMKVRVPGGVGGDVASALGVTGIQVPAPKVYETLASNAADGVVMPYESRRGFKLTEVAQNVFDLPGGLYRGSFAIIMNEDAFADLPEELQTALNDKVFGAPLSRELGRIWDVMDQQGHDLTTETAGNAIHAASAADLESFQTVVQQVTEKVLGEIGEAGINANAAYELVKATMAAN